MVASFASLASRSARSACLGGGDQVELAKGLEIGACVLGSLTPNTSSVPIVNRPGAPVVPLKPLLAPTLETKVRLEP